jgi:hypothetical protein
MLTASPKVATHRNLRLPSTSAYRIHQMLRLALPFPLASTPALPLSRMDLAQVRAICEAAMREYRMPARIRTDNGAPFSGTGILGLSKLGLGWMKLGIVHERIQPGRPQQDGRHERMHRTLKEDTMKPPAASLRSQQSQFDRFRQVFNHERPHEGLEQPNASEPLSTQLRSIATIHAGIHLPQGSPAATGEQTAETLVGIRTGSSSARYSASRSWDSRWSDKGFTESSSGIWRSENSTWKSFVLELHGAWSELGVQKAGHGNERVWKAMKPASHPSHTLWKSLRDSHIFCGPRASEVMGLQWKSWIGEVLMPHGTAYEGQFYAGRLKTRQSKAPIPVPELVWSVIEAWRRVCPNHWGRVRADHRT